MKRTISLGIELAEYANEITDVFTTVDYVSILRKEYVDHVMNFYNPSSNNLFTVIYDFQKTILDEKHILTPCREPLKDLSSSAPLLSAIINNKGAYKQVVKALKKSCPKRSALGSLVRDLLDAILKGDHSLRTAALYYDQHAGNVLTASQVIQTVYAYGELTGLVDYYNFKEKLHGEEIEHSQT